jgi:ABC-type sulfate transport system permease subunit
MLAAFTVSLASVLAKRLGASGTGYPFGIEPIYAGLATSLLLYGAGWLTKPERS